jgi:hypothetical protein
LTVKYSPSLAISTAATLFLFNVVDKALGKSANKLTDKDFKKINIEIESTSNTTSDELSDDTIDDEEDLSDEEIEDTADAQDDSSDNEEESLNEDDEIAKPIKPSYFFLKITTK